MTFYTQDELNDIGLKDVGENALISKKCSLYNPADISIGSNTRIDDFCILSAGKGGIKIGSHVHIACYSSCIGAASIVLEDFSGLSGRVSIYSSSENFTGTGLTNPTVPDKYRAVTNGDVIIGRHSIIGAGSVVLPGTQLKEGVAVGAMSLVKGVCESYGIYAGNPLKRIRDREKNTIARLESEFLAERR